MTALSPKAEDKTRRVGILDCEQHYGDGSAEIMAALRFDWIQYVSQENWSPDDVKPFMDKWPEVVRRFNGCDLLIYQAGADPYIADPLGGLLSTVELAKHDQIISPVAKSFGIFVV